MKYHQFHRLASISFLVLAIQFVIAQPVSTTVKDSLQSNVLKEKRTLWVNLPKDYNDSTELPRNYPVLYLLDPEIHFEYVNSLIKELSVYNGNMMVPEMIVVGIPNRDRMKDMTPTHVDVNKLNGDSAMVRTSGGGENFIQFLRTELISYIDKQYRTLPNRTFVGHSLGGLIAIHTLLNHPDLFDNYIAIDPSLWWDDEKLVNQATELLKNNQRYQKKSLFIAIGNTFFTGGTPDQARTDTSRSSTAVKPQLLLSDKIAANKNNGLRFRYRYYPDDTHGSVPLSGIHDGLRFVFDFYDFRIPNEAQLNFGMANIQAYEKHFDKVAQQFGFPFPPPEITTESLTGLAFYTKKMPEAEYLLKLNLKHYPKSHWAHVNMGDYYRMTGNKELAAEYYSKAQQLKYVASTEKKIKSLSAEQKSK